jgi:apolipoprotein N-acyltransferase
MKKRERTKETKASAVAPAPVAGPTAVRSRAELLKSMLACAVGGVAMVLSFAPFALFPLAWFGIAALFVAMERATPRRAVLLAFVFGLALFGAGAYWLLPGLLRHGGYSLEGSLVAVAIMMATLSTNVAFVGASRAVGGADMRAMRLLVVMPGVWVVVEWSRSVLNGFPWLSLGYGQIDSPLAGFAPVGGVYLVSLASALIGGALAYAWFERKRWWVPVGAIAVLALVGAGLGTVTWTRPEGRALEIAGVQGNVASDIKWTPAQLQPTLDLYAAETLKAMQGRSLDAVVWPETAITARPDQVAPFLAGLQGAAQTGGTTVIFGIIDVDRSEGGARYFNAALAAGATQGGYRKRQLVPLTEYLPHFLPDQWRDEKMRDAIAIFSPGAEVQPLLRVADVTIGVTICYETAYGRLVRPMAEAPGLLMGLTNDDWFMGTTMPAQDHQVARMRALESGRQMLRVANSGITAWIDADGRTLRELPVLQRATLFASMQPRVGHTLYWRIGEFAWFIVLLLFCIAAAVVAFVGKRRHDALRQRNI